MMPWHLKGLSYYYLRPSETKMPAPSRGYHFLFTLNNPTTGEASDLDKIDCKYFVRGSEIGESGTPHLQCHIWFKKQKTVSAVIKVLPVRCAKIQISASPEKSIVYCKKDDDFVERGTPPKQKKQQGKDEQARWRAIRMASREGRLDEVPEYIRYHHHKLIDFHRNEYLQEKGFDYVGTKHLWYWGASRTGKSRKARDDNPGYYLKACNKWWCGYKYEEVVIIEDFDNNHACLNHYLKLWADGHSFAAEHKGGKKTLRPRLIIVTSNYHPSEIWPDPQDFKGKLEPILERFDCKEFVRQPTTNLIFSSHNIPTETDSQPAQSTVAMDAFEEDYNCDFPENKHP